LDPNKHIEETVGFLFSVLPSWVDTANKILVTYKKGGLCFTMFRKLFELQSEFVGISPLYMPTASDALYVAVMLP